MVGVEAGLVRKVPTKRFSTVAKWDVVRSDSEQRTITL